MRLAANRGFGWSCIGGEMLQAVAVRGSWVLLGALVVIGCSSAAKSVSLMPTGQPSSAAAATPSPPSACITTAGGRTVLLKLEVADTAERRSVGLSRRESLPEDAGMLFVFPGDQQAAFWMKDTLIPLSIAFVSADGIILEIQDMEPLSEELHRPSRSYRYALEVNQGFFVRNGVAVGDKVEFELGGGS